MTLTLLSFILSTGKASSSVKVITAVLPYFSGVASESIAAPCEYALAAPRYDEYANERKTESGAVIRKVTYAFVML